MRQADLGPVGVYYFLRGICAGLALLLARDCAHWAGMEWNVAPLPGHFALEEPNASKQTKKQTQACATMSAAKVTRRDTLRYVKFGTTDMMVSECCIGTMTWGSFIDDEAKAQAQLDAAIAAGANFIDTA